MISVDEALERLAGATAALPAERVPLEQARGRVLAAAVLADRDFPPTDRSAMDGFAVRAADLREEGAALRVVGELRAGAPSRGIDVPAGGAVRVFTGAVIPEGADAVVMLEDTREEPERGVVVVSRRVERGANIRRRAEDISGGVAVLRAGVPIGPAEIAALAAVGCHDVPVHARPGVAVLSTGDEIVEPDESPLPHQVRNSNAPVLLAQLSEMGLAGRYLGVARDSTGSLARELRRGLGADVLLVSGGVSVGQYDLVRAELERAGLHVLFHGVRVKPGKPLLAGRAGSCLVFGLPGNPLSALCCFAVFVAPALRRLMGHDVWRSPFLPARLAAALRNRPGRRTFHLVRLRSAAHGLEAHPVVSSGSGDLLAAARANGFLVTREDDGDLDAGTSRPALPWPDLQRLA